MNNQLYIQIPLDASYFLKSEFQIDRLLDFCDWSSPASDNDVRQAIELMVPTGCNKELIRIGGSGDGAYLLPDDLTAIDACFCQVFPRWSTSSFSWLRILEFPLIFAMHRLTVISFS